MIGRLRALNDARRRGAARRLAQLALAWALRDERVTSLVIGASSVEQLEQNVAALDNLELSAEELAEIDGTSRPTEAWMSGGKRGKEPCNAGNSMRLDCGQRLTRALPSQMLQTCCSSAGMA